MKPKKPQSNTANSDRIIAAAQRNRLSRESGYREQALKLYPWICGRCAREFTRENVQQLTVHHRDHNHDNNPSDGSNWELLCVYCHDNEHARYLEQAEATTGKAGGKSAVVATQQPFAGLKDLLKGKS